MNSCVPDELAVPAPLMAPVVLLLANTNIFEMEMVFDIGIRKYIQVT